MNNLLNNEDFKKNIVDHYKELCSELIENKIVLIITYISQTELRLS